MTDEQIKAHAEAKLVALAECGAERTGSRIPRLFYWPEDGRMRYARVSWIDEKWAVEWDPQPPGPEERERRREARERLESLLRT